MIIIGINNQSLNDKFTWTFRSDTRILIVTEIQNETDLNQIEVPIGNEILIVRTV